MQPFLLALPGLQSHLGATLPGLQAVFIQRFTELEQASTGLVANICIKLGPREGDWTPSKFPIKAEMSFASTQLILCPLCSTNPALPWDSSFLGTTTAEIHTSQDLSFLSAPWSHWENESGQPQVIWNQQEKFSCPPNNISDKLYPFFHSSNMYCGTTVC